MVRVRASVTQTPTLTLTLVARQIESPAANSNLTHSEFIGTRISFETSGHIATRVSDRCFLGRLGTTKVKPITRNK